MWNYVANRENPLWHTFIVDHRQQPAILFT